MRKQGAPMPVSVGDELMLLSGETVSGTATVEKLTPTQIVTDKGRFRRDGSSLNRYAGFHVDIPANGQLAEFKVDREAKLFARVSSEAAEAEYRNREEVQLVEWIIGECEYNEDRVLKLPIENLREAARLLGWE